MIEGTTQPKRTGRVRLLLVLGVGVVVLASVAGIALRQQSSPTGPPAAIRVSGLPPAISTDLANLMQLGTLPGTPAPEFTLIDQNGTKVSLNDYRGRAVVLEFMDPNCVDICPIVSQEYLLAYRALGADAAKVAFLAINVNPFHLDPAAMDKYSIAHGLAAIPSWRFLGGLLPEVQNAWAAYHVQVKAPNPTADVVHTSVAYFIDSQGRERYLAFPMVDHTASGSAFLPAGTQQQWGTGLALVLRSLI